ncbi:efflux RND transporter permease subunit [Streptomyces sp. NBC_00620]|uniref:MMPL family transporter n=1 Tax=Streptomyces sp. NBC_00620 TaxID=2903666 RepID=UPI00225C2C03|nr:MMPL family transporter [Streptomyces sp. NBC_00620]MCX4974410.1 MMPL family transporter [Streptomyces sp. NBC_00620]
MYDRISELALRRGRLVLILTAVAVVAMAVIGFGAFGKLLGGGFEDPSAPSTRAQQLIDEKFGGESNLVLLVRADDGDIGSGAAERAGSALTSDLKGEPTVANVISYWDTGASSLTSRDGNEALVLAHIKGDETEQADNASAIIDEYTGERDGLTVQAGGAAAVGNEIPSQVAKDLAVAEAIAVPLILILLVIAFGSVVAALIPLVIGLIAIVGTFAELYVLGSLTDVSVFSINLTTALGLGLGIDYALLMISRFREHLAEGAEVPEALRHTVRTAGRTITFAAATVAIALSALLVFPQYFLRSFAYAGIGVVVIAAVSALLVVPALLAVLGHRVNNGRLPWAKTVRSAEAPLWGRLARTVMRRPALTALPVLAILLLAASPLLGVVFGTPDERVLPESAQSRQVATAVQNDFTGSDESAVQIVTTGPVAPAALSAYATDLSRLDGAARVETSAGTFSDGRSTPPGPAAAALGRPDAQRIAVISDLTPHSDEAQNLVTDIRAIDPPAGTEALVGGNDARLIDAKASIADRLPFAIGLVAGTTFVILFLFTGSVVQPLRALVLNGISLTAAIGVMVWIFQDGHLSSLLGFTPQPMDTSMTVLMFCIAFGLSMDYEVFVTSRIKELHDAGADTETAVTSGLSHTGRIVTMAAGLLAVSFFAFGTANVSFIQMFGLGSGLAILIDAVAVRGVLVPAAMRLLGRTAWYAPKPLRAVHERLGISEGGPAEERRTPAKV